MVIYNFVLKLNLCYNNVHLLIKIGLLNNYRHVWVNIYLLGMLNKFWMIKAIKRLIISAPGDMFLWKCLNVF